MKGVRDRESNFQYCHLFDGDFDYGRWEGKPTKLTKKESNRAYAKRQRDYKRKYE